MDLKGDTVMSTPRAWHTTMPSTLGKLTLVRDARALRGLYFPHHWYMPEAATFGPLSNEGFADAVKEIEQYLAGERREFDLLFAPVGDEFLRRVRNRLQQIPYGDTITYGELATAIGGGATAQQIGAAVGRNPLCILIPCHRVVGHGGKLTGYAGGIERKRHLLELEREQAALAERRRLQHAPMTGLS
jgi:methylated-DNA-[protein]-cysteine S-methyltransferase